MKTLTTLILTALSYLSYSRTHVSITGNPYNCCDIKKNEFGCKSNKQQYLLDTTALSIKRPNL